MIISLFSSVLFLVAIAMTYAVAGTVNLAQLAERLQEVPPGVRTLLEAMLLTVFAIKAAVFPLAAWLPDSYPTAPAPVTAVFAGLLTKVGVYSMLRTQTLLFPGHRLGDLLMLAALASMVVGILGAVAQTDLKRVLSFTLISHIGYMVFGIASRAAAGSVARSCTWPTTSPCRPPCSSSPDSSSGATAPRNSPASAAWPGRRRCSPCCSSCPP